MHHLSPVQSLCLNTGLLLCAHNAEGENEKRIRKKFPDSFWWREEDSNLRPLGYEPNELPLLHPAMYRFYRCKGSEFSDTVQQQLC